MVDIFQNFDASIFLILRADGGSIAVASAEVKLFDLSSKKRLRKFPGHPVR